MPPDSRFTPQLTYNSALGLFFPVEPFDGSEQISVLVPKQLQALLLAPNVFELDFHLPVRVPFRMGSMKGSVVNMEFDCGLAVGIPGNPRSMRAILDIETDRPFLTVFVGGDPVTVPQTMHVVKLRLDTAAGPIVG